MEYAVTIMIIAAFAGLIVAAGAAYVRRARVEQERRAVFIWESRQFMEE